MNKQTHEMLSRLERAGIEYDDALALRRISMTLDRWNELECGDGNVNVSWAIERDETTGVPYMVRHYHGPGVGHMPRITRTRVPDREKGALKRLEKIIAKYPGIKAYTQGDPRGASLWILRPGDIPDGVDAGSCYTNGIAVFK